MEPWTHICVLIRIFGLNSSFCIYEPQLNLVQVKNKHIFKESNNWATVIHNLKSLGIVLNSVLYRRSNEELHQQASCHWCWLLGFGYFPRWKLCFLNFTTVQKFKVMRQLFIMLFTYCYSKRQYLQWQSFPSNSYKAGHNYSHGGPYQGVSECVFN